MGSGEPELEGDGSLMDQHREAIVGAAAFALRELEKRSQRGLIDRIVNEVGTIDAVVGKDRWVACFESQRRGVDQQVAVEAMRVQVGRIEA